jgi:hypothetical protein
VLEGAKAEGAVQEGATAEGDDAGGGVRELFFQEAPLEGAEVSFAMAAEEFGEGASGAGGEEGVGVEEGEPQEGGEGGSGRAFACAHEASQVNRAQQGNLRGDPWHRPSSDFF